MFISYVIGNDGSFHRLLSLSFDLAPLAIEDQRLAKVSSQSLAEFMNA